MGGRCAAWSTPAPQRSHRKGALHTRAGTGRVHPCTAAADKRVRQLAGSRPEQGRHAKAWHAAAHHHQLAVALAALQAAAAAIQRGQPLHRLALVLAKGAKGLRGGAAGGDAAGHDLESCCHTTPHSHTPLPPVGTKPRHQNGATPRRRAPPSALLAPSHLQVSLPRHKLLQLPVDPRQVKAAPRRPRGTLGLHPFFLQPLLLAWRHMREGSGSTARHRQGQVR